MQELYLSGEVNLEDWNYIIKSLFSLHKKFEKFKGETNPDAIKWLYNPQEIKFIEGLLFLSMIPLHKDNFSRQKVFYLKAIELLNDTVKIRGKLNNEKVLSLVRSRG